MEYFIDSGKGIAILVVTVSTLVLLMLRVRVKVRLEVAQHRDPDVALPSNGSLGVSSRPASGLCYPCLIRSCMHVRICDPSLPFQLRQYPPSTPSPIAALPSNSSLGASSRPASGLCCHDGKPAQL